MAAQSAEAPKRFYKTARPAALEGGLAVMLDGRALRTPGNTRLLLPTEGLADLIAAEWSAQGETIDLAGMHATRLAFTAADRIAMARGQTVTEIVQFAGSDLLCYFATAPQALVQRQTAQWGPVLDWADRTLGVRLEPVAGIIHRPQPAESLARIQTICAAVDDFVLAGLAYGTALYGSAVLALAVFKGELNGEAAFDVSRLDEAFQEEHWGVDDDAALRTARRRQEAVMLNQWFSTLRY
jgi:chaperone required for assembly of F1-ATPase